MLLLLSIRNGRQIWCRSNISHS
uniref:Uncharacterized protein n=1 Tax=Anguilla anguilla TaxID=7936 RepID=A0A0E9UQD2_ANGAN